MYSVFIDKKPIRFAFLVNPQDEKWAEQLDAIWEYTLDKWRGRFNLVVPTNGDIIDKEWWEFLKRIDPDYVISTTQISDGLKDKINAEIHPIDIETPSRVFSRTMTRFGSFQIPVRFQRSLESLFHYRRLRYSLIFNLAGHLTWR